MVARDRFRAGAEPLHRAAGSLGGQHDGNEFGIDLVTYAEAAANVDRSDTDFFRRNPDHAGKRVANIRCALRRNAQLVAVVRLVVANGA
jgi:hypothetical protein